VSAIVEARPAPAIELRTSLSLAALAAALIHVMSAVHDDALVAELGAAGILAVLAALLAFSSTRAVLGPAIGFTAVLTIGLPNLLATPPQVILAGGALALLWGGSDRALLRWSRLAFAVFAIAAITGFGHLAH
jgi:hypothetical protein